MSTRVTTEEKRKPTSLRTCRTFGDLMELRAPSTGYLSHCKRCRAYGPEIPHWHYSARASICEECATRAKDELLPRVATAERRARSWVKTREVKQEDARWVANLSGASEDYVRELIRAKAAKAVQS